MGKIDYRYLNLSFISEKEEIKKQIINTAIFSFLERTFNTVLELNQLVESTQYGYNAPALNSGRNKFLRISDIKDGKVNWETVPFCDCSDEKSYRLHSNDLLVARTGGTTGKSFLISETPKNAVFAGYLIRLRANEKILPEFLNLFLNSYAYWSQISEMKSGSAQPNVNAEKLKKLLIPYCSVQEQKNILNLLTNGRGGNQILKRLKNQIESVQAEYQKNNELIELFNHQSSLITKLRQSILQEAVQGKLVAPNSKDEPASVLLEKIKKEKQKLIAEGKLKKEKELPPITKDEMPFELPEDWVWCRLGEIISLMDSGWSPACEGHNAEVNNWGVLKTTAVQEMKYLDFENKQLPAKLFPKQQYETKVGDILITRAGPTNRVGVCCLVEATRNKLMISDKIIRFHPFEKYVSAKYITLCLNTGISKDFIADKKSGMAASQVNISQDQLKLTPIPLPSYNEQQRIVSKVEELMKTCDALEKEVDTQKEKVKALMQAVLREAFEGEEAHTEEKPKKAQLA